MGLNIAGATIAVNGLSGVTLNNSLIFNSVGQGSTSSTPGFSGVKSGGSYYYSTPTGWDMNSFSYNSGHFNGPAGIFTCPITGYYAIGYNGIHRGGSNIPVGYNTYGYAGFGKNGGLSYFVHWNMSATNAWNTGGTSALFSCVAGDTLALFVNRSPAPQGTADNFSQNFGLYPDTHHAIWCKLVG